MMMMMMMHTAYIMNACLAWLNERRSYRSSTV